MAGSEEMQAAGRQQAMRRCRQQTAGHEEMQAADSRYAIELAVSAGWDGGCRQQAGTHAIEPSAVMTEGGTINEGDVQQHAGGLAINKLRVT